MSRLEKARYEKNKGRKRSKAILFIALGILFIAGLITLVYQDLGSDWFWQEEADLIDMDRSIAFMDLFELTYVRVYIIEGKEVSVVTANGEDLNYNREFNRWELIISGYETGDEIKITAVSEEDEAFFQEEVIIVEKL